MMLSIIIARWLKQLNFDREYVISTDERIHRYYEYGNLYIFKISNFLNVLVKDLNSCVNVALPFSLAPSTSVTLSRSSMSPSKEIQCIYKEEGESYAFYLFT